MYAVEYSMAPSEEKEDQAVLSTVYTTVSYCLHREEGDKEETKRECAKETWRLQREIPLFVSEDGNSRLNLMDGEEELLVHVVIACSLFRVGRHPLGVGGDGFDDDGDRVYLAQHRVRLG